MTDPPSYDNHLLDRLNALKKSSITLEPSKPKLVPSKPSTPEQDLSARLRSLRNASVSPSPSPVTLLRAISFPRPRPEPEDEKLTFFPPIPASNPLDDDPLRNPHALETDDKTLDDLLAELGPEDQWTLNPDDPKDIQRLLDEARTALPDEDTRILKLSETEGSNENNSNTLPRDLDMSVFSTNDHDDSEDEDAGDPASKPSKEECLAAESREANDIIARAIDEASLEKDNLSESTQTNNERNLTLPSTPSTLSEPTIQTSYSGMASSITARMAALRIPSSSLSLSSPFPSAPTNALTPKPAPNALDLPSAPTFAPVTKPLPTVQKNPAFTDEDIDGWCIICQDGSTVKCAGCDSNLYCATCWKEGHMGPDAGWEEKRHKWVKWRKPS